MSALLQHYVEMCSFGPEGECVYEALKNVFKIHFKIDVLVLYISNATVFLRIKWSFQ